jgi:hypothetical protein
MGQRPFCSRSHARLRGTTTMVALVMLTVLASLSATTLLSMSARYNSAAHAVAWRQAMDAAESGSCAGASRTARRRHSLPPFWTAAVIANETYDFPLVDSYDPTHPAKSAPDGTYSSSQRQYNGDVLVNSTNPPLGKIYGDASINADGIFTGWGADGSKAGISNVVGDVSNDVHIPTPPVTTPSWSVTATNLGAGPATITASGTTSYFQPARHDDQAARWPDQRHGLRLCRGRHHAEPSPRASPRRSILPAIS